MRADHPVAKESPRPRALSRMTQAASSLSPSASLPGPVVPNTPWSRSVVSRIQPPPCAASLPPCFRASHPPSPSDPSDVHRDMPGSSSIPSQTASPEWRAAGWIHQPLCQGLPQPPEGSKSPWHPSGTGTRAPSPASHRNPPAERRGRLPPFVASPGPCKAPKPRNWTSWRLANRSWEASARPQGRVPSSAAWRRCRSRPARARPDQTPGHTTRRGTSKVSANCYKQRHLHIFPKEMQRTQTPHDRLKAW